MSMEVSDGGASVGSSDRNGGNNMGHERHIVNIPNEEFSEEEMEQFKSFNDVIEMVNKTSQGTDAKPKIQKVPSMLRDNNKFKKYFEPKVFSFGPYYHKRPTLEVAKQIKVILADDFLKQNDVKKEDLNRDIRNEIKKLKDCYVDGLIKDYKDHELAWMFLVDGCAILQFMNISINYLEDKDTQFRNLKINFDYEFAQDLFLLENQLPFQLLQLIIRRASKQQKTKEDQEQSKSSKEDKRALKKELLESIYKFIFYRFRTPEEWYKNKDEILKDHDDPHVHLLDLLRKMLIQPLHQKAEKRDLIEIIIDRTVPLFNKLKCNRHRCDRDGFPVPHRNIKKLREAGINLKRSKTGCVNDISFSGGTLKLPPIIVEESTVIMFLNMLGFEMCPDFQNKSEVSTYMYFMNELIDRTQDVEELREKNILQNQLGSDEEVIKLFNEISTYLFPNFGIYDEVKRNIDYYFDNKWLVYFHQYFNRRWTLPAFIGSLLILACTIIQTVTTVLAYQADSKKGINPQLMI